jgi:hypothetical protein
MMRNALWGGWLVRGSCFNGVLKQIYTEKTKIFGIFIAYFVRNFDDRVSNT